MTDSDASLVARVVRDDDRAAFELLVRRYQSPLRNFLRRLTRDTQSADDLAQDTFLRVYRSIETYRGSAKFSTWLYRIAYNLFLNSERRRVALAEFDENLHSPETDQLGATTTALDVDAALLHLPLRQRAVFDLHYRKGLTQDEVAAAIAIPLGTVKSDLTRGRERLKELLEND